MKHIQRILLCLIFNFAKGQTPTEWFPIGAEWYYSNPNIRGNIRQQCVKYKVLKDTVWEGNISKQIKISSCIGDTIIDYEYFNQNGGQIKYLNKASNQFFVLFDFGKIVGDTIVVHEGEFIPNESFFSPYVPISNFIYTINSVETININGIDLKMQKIESYGSSSFNFMSYLGLDTTFNNTIIERIGPMTNLTGNFRGVIPESYYPFLRCYNDMDIEFKQPNSVVECIPTSSISNEYFNKVAFDFYPNPQKREQSIKISTNEDFKIISINTLSGSEVPFIIDDDLLKISSSESGVFFIQILIGDRLVNRKIILI